MFIGLVYIQAFILYWCSRFLDLFKKESLFAYNLTLFAAEDEGKTEDASETKKRRAREEEGRVVNSQEVNQVVVLLVGLTISALTAPNFASKMRSYTTNVFEAVSTRGEIANIAQMQVILFSIVQITVSFVGPILVATFLTAIASNLAQTRFLFTMANIKLDFSKIAPTWKNFTERVGFSKQNIQKLLVLLFKVAIIAVITVLTIRGYYEGLLFTIRTSVKDAILLMGRAVLEMLFKVIAFMLIVAAFDYFLQRRQFLEQLKMTKQEVKEEFKESEGDPYVKARIMERMRQMLFRNMYQAVPKADVVIMNPTHFAVALQYSPGETEAPRIVAKGADHIALRIRDIALENGVPVERNVFLARELYFNSEIGDVVPERLYEIVSIIFSKVYRMRETPQSVVS